MKSLANTKSTSPLPKVMLLTKPLQVSGSGGREMLCKLNHVALREIYGDRLVLFELPPTRRQGLKSLLDAFRGHIDGLNDAVITKALQTIQVENVSKVFVDGSNLGRFVKVVKQKLPQTEVSTFFHNIEARFFLGALRQFKTLRALAVLMVNYLVERKSVRYSDKIICLSERDSRLLYKLYGRAATHVSPMALQDKLPKDIGLLECPSREKFALFVGGTFYANSAGIGWYVANVAPQASVKVYVVGRGFERLRSSLEIPGKVEVVGGVDDLAEWYRAAAFVIAPIFDGSGMKTKVAEALMHGKKIVGTPEAFSGYEEVAPAAGWICRDAAGFLRAMDEARATITHAFDPGLRELYVQNYSLKSATARMSAIMETPTCAKP